MVYAGSGGFTDNDAIRELRDTVKELNTTLKGATNSNDRFSKAFMVLALVQILFASASLAFEMMTPQQTGLRFLVYVLTIGSASLFFYKLFPRNK